MNYKIREMRKSEYGLLEDFLYEAIFQRDGEDPAPRTIINRPELQIYIENFGKKKGDCCLCAEADGEVVGAVWVRNINGYGSIDDETLEFAIAIHKPYRGQGIGTELMRKMLGLLQSVGCEKASLSVQKDNYALKMYKNVGFEVVKETGEEYVMLYKFEE